MLPKLTPGPFVDDLPVALGPTKDRLYLVGEEWRSIQGFEGQYEVSSYGRVRSVPRKGRIQVKILALKQQEQAMTVGLAMKRFFVKELVVAAFELETPVGHEWGYENGNSLDNRLANLVCGPRPNRPPTSKPLAISQHIKARRDKLVGVYENGVMVAQHCRDCQHPLPLSAFTSLNTPFGVRQARVCRSCENLIQKLGKRGARKVLDEQYGVAEGFRCCAHCHELKELDEQHFRPNTGTTGFNYICLDCRPYPKTPPATQQGKAVWTKICAIIAAGKAGNPHQVVAHAQLLAEALDKLGQVQEAGRVRRVLGEAAGTGPE